MSEYLSFYVQRYFMSYLMKQHNYGANTISSYRDTFRLLLAFMAESNTDISKIEIYDISHERVLEFMTWLAEVRKNGVFLYLSFRIMFLLRLHIYIYIYRETLFNL